MVTRTGAISGAAVVPIYVYKIL